MKSHQEQTLNLLKETATKLRLTALEMIHRRQAGHPGGCLSAADIIAALYFHVLNIDPKKPDDMYRDRFILSKGHASALLYAALAERGYFPKEDLLEWGNVSCHLQGHPDKNKTPGVDMTSGVLGHGVSVGAGLALGAKLGRMPYRTYVLLGDGECQSGIVWEGAMIAGKYRLNNLTVIVDYNGVQLDGFVHDVMPLEPFVDKWKAFNLNVIEIDGHNMRQILEGIEIAGNIHDRTTVVVARTVKGKGVSFMENSSRWHGNVPSEDELARARIELLGGTARRGPGQ